MQITKIKVVELDSCKTNENRLTTIRNWYNAYEEYQTPSVLIIGYEMFARLVMAEEDIPPPTFMGRPIRNPRPKKKKKKKKLTKRQMENKQRLE